MTIFTGIIAYFLITTPFAVLMGDALKKSRRTMARITNPTTSHPSLD